MKKLPPVNPQHVYRFIYRRHSYTYYSHTYNIRYAIRSCLRGVVTIVKFFLIFIIMNRNLFFVIMDCCCCILVANTLPIPTLLLLSTYTTLRPKYVFLPIHFILHTVSDCKFFNHPQ